MGSFNTAKTDQTLRALFQQNNRAPVDKTEILQSDPMSSDSIKEQAITLLKRLTPQEIMEVIAAVMK